MRLLHMTNANAIAIALTITCCFLMPPLVAAEDCFGIRVIDDATRRGVPLVTLTTVNHQVFVTDSNGWAAIAEPGWAGQTVWFEVASHGYDLAKDGFGYAGKAIAITPGGRTTLALHRRNIAERLYRVTGEGIYRDSVLLGEHVPLRRPLLDGLVLGQDTVFAALYQGRIHWLWGDTNRLGYPLGCFRTTGATSELPLRGGLDPDQGVDLSYLTDASGFCRPICPMPDEKDGLFWMSALTALPDHGGRERLLARYTKIKEACTVIAHGIAVWNDETRVFDRAKALDLKEPWRFPEGHPLRWQDEGQDWLLFTTSALATVRTRPTCEGFLDTASYEAFTCLANGATMDGAATRLQRDAGGRPSWRWTTQAPPLTQEQERTLVAAGAIPADAAHFQCHDPAGRRVQICNGSVSWNAYRKAWVLIGQEKFGHSPFGEIWFGAAPSPMGPWRTVVKIVSHDRYTFYNPTQHPFFDADGGRRIYFEGTYTATFSGNPVITPRYDYNQIMYRLDLADARLQEAGK